MPSEVTASIPHAASNRCATRPTTTTSESQPHVMLSIASARIARLPSWRATVSFRRATHGELHRRRQPERPEDRPHLFAHVGPEEEDRDAEHGHRDKPHRARANDDPPIPDL